MLLGLARGSGARSLAGMAAVAGQYRRPLLAVTRETVRAAVPPGLTPWEDPQNSQMALARVRARHRVLPVMETELGPGISAALARTADLLRADADALDAWAARAIAESMIEGGSPGRQPQQLDVGLLATYPQAVRRRVLRRAAIAGGSPPTDLTFAHVDAMDSLIVSGAGRSVSTSPANCERPAQPTSYASPRWTDRRLNAPDCGRLRHVDPDHVGADLAKVLLSESDIQHRLGEVAAEIERDYEGRDLLLVGVLKGAVVVMADLSRHFRRHVETDWMAVSSYGSGTKSSGVVRILKDLDADLTGRNVIIVEDIIDTGLTLSWLVANLVHAARPQWRSSPFAQTRGRKDPSRRPLCRFRHPQRVRRRLRLGLRGALSQPAGRCYPRPAHTLTLRAGTWGWPPESAGTVSRPATFLICQLWRALSRPGWPGVPSGGPTSPAGRPPDTLVTGVPTGRRRADRLPSWT